MYKSKKTESPAFHRPTSKEEDVTERHSYVISKCSICKDTVGDIVDTVVKYTEDIDLKPHPLVTNIPSPSTGVVIARRVKSNNILPISRIGINVMGYILYARYQLQLPIKKIKESLADLYNFKISEGEIFEKLKDIQALFGKINEILVQLIL